MCRQEGAAVIKAANSTVYFSRIKSTILLGHTAHTITQLYRSLANTLTVTHTLNSDDSKNSNVSCENATHSEKLSNTFVCLPKEWLRQYGSSCLSPVLVASYPWPCIRRHTRGLHAGVADGSASARTLTQHTSPLSSHRIRSHFVCRFSVSNQLDRVGLFLFVRVSHRSIEVCVVSGVLRRLSFNVRDQRNTGRDFVNRGYSFAPRDRYQCAIPTVPNDNLFLFLYEMSRMIVLFQRMSAWSSSRALAPFSAHKLRTLKFSFLMRKSTQFGDSF